MARYCSDCINIDLKDSKGKGCYKCKKIKEYVLTNTYACDKFENAYARRNYEKENIYNEGKNYKEEEKNYPIFLYIIIFILLLLAKIFTN